MFRLLAWSVTGLRVVESSTMTPRPSFCGSTRRTNWELSRCSKVLILEQCSLVSLRQPQRLSKSPALLTTITWATLHRVQQTWELLFEPQYTLLFQISARRRMNSKLSQISTMCRSVASMVSTQSLPTTCMTFLTGEDLADLRSTLSKICTMALKPWWQERRNSRLLQTSE